MEGVEAAGCPQAAWLLLWCQTLAAAAALAGGPCQQASSWAAQGVAAGGPSRLESSLAAAGEAVGGPFQQAPARAEAEVEAAEGSFLPGPFEAAVAGREAGRAVQDSGLALAPAPLVKQGLFWAEAVEAGAVPSLAPGWGLLQPLQALACPPGQVHFARAPQLHLEASAH